MISSGEEKEIAGRGGSLEAGSCSAHHCQRTVCVCVFRGIDVCVCMFVCFEWEKAEE